MYGNCTQCIRYIQNHCVVCYIFTIVPCRQHVHLYIIFFTVWLKREYNSSRRRNVNDCRISRKLIKRIHMYTLQQVIKIIIRPVCVYSYFQRLYNVNRHILTNVYVVYTYNHRSIIMHLCTQIQLYKRKDTFQFIRFQRVYMNELRAFIFFVQGRSEP